MHTCKDSQRDVAKQVGVNAGTLNRWLTGAHEPRIPEALALAYAYGLTVDQLFNPAIPLPTEITRRFAVQPPPEVIEQTVREAVEEPPAAPEAPPHAQKARASRKAAKARRHKG